MHCTVRYLGRAIVVAALAVDVEQRLDDVLLLLLGLLLGHHLALAGPF
jgi:hypothetical protein